MLAVWFMKLYAKPKSALTLLARRIGQGFLDFPPRACWLKKRTGYGSGTPLECNLDARGSLQAN